MGEIADALRRARERIAPDPRPIGGGGAASAALPIADLVSPHLSEPAGRADALPELSERRIATLLNADPAVAVTEGPQVEACRRIALRVRAQLDAARAHSVAIVSAGRADGKTTVACNLALALASLSQGRQVALVDLDLRNPSVAKSLGLAPSTGIEEVLHDRASAADVQVSIDEPELDVYPAFTPPARSHELLVLPRLAALIDQLERRYETVVIDTPPVLMTPDASLILKHVGACIPIARAGWTRQRSFRALVDALPRRMVLDALPRRAVLDPLLNGGRAPGYYSNDDYYSHVRGPGEGAKAIDWATLRKRWSRHGG